MAEEKEILKKIEEKKLEFEQFMKLAPSPVDVEVAGKKYTIMPPTLWVMNNVEKLFTEISLQRLKVAQKLTENEQALDELMNLFAQHVDIAAKIVQVILDGRPREKHVVEIEEIMNEWTIIDLVKVFKAYEYMIDLSDFFQAFRIPRVQ